MLVERRTSLAELLGLMIAGAQAVAGLTLALLVVHDQASTGAEAGAGLLFAGVLFGALGASVLVLAWSSARGSLPGRFGLVGAEAVMAVAGFFTLGAVVGTMVVISAVAVVVLFTVLSFAGRPR